MCSGRRKSEARGRNREAGPGEGGSQRTDGVRTPRSEMISETTLLGV